MLAKSKIKKLKTDLKKFKVSSEEIETSTGVSRQYVNQILNSKKYNRDVVLSLIRLRDDKKTEAIQLETLI